MKIGNSKAIRLPKPLLMTTCGRPYPSRVDCRFAGTRGQAVLAGMFAP